MTRHARTDRPPVPPTLAPMINSFELSLTGARKSRKTITIYTDAVRWLAGSVAPGTTWEDVASDVVHLRLFLAGFADHGYSISYGNNIGRALQQFFGWLAVEEGLPNPFGPRLKVPPPPKPGHRPPPIIASEQLAALLKDAERTRSFVDRRDAAILHLFACTGCRLAELSGVQLDRLDLPAREMTVTGKADKVRTVRFDQIAAVALDRYVNRARPAHPHATKTTALWLRTRGPGGLTPNGVYQMLTRRSERLGFAIHPHLFRHTFTHRWLDAGGAEGDLMELMGWDSPQMLRHYGRSARGARARRAYDRVKFREGI